MTKRDRDMLIVAALLFFAFRKRSATVPGTPRPIGPVTSTIDPSLADAVERGARGAGRPGATSSATFGPEGDSPITTVPLAAEPELP